jgi:hypothetical protein
MNTIVAVPKRAQASDSQKLASRRLTPIKAARETTNRIAARVKVGAATGEKSAVETSV